MKVFIIDDDPVFCLEIESLLSKMGYDFCGKAHSYSEGLDQIKNLLPEVVICDIRIGDTHSGIDLANEVLEFSIPFVFVTAYSDQEVYQNSRDYPFSKFIVKPFDALTLQGILDDLSQNIINFTATKSIKGKALFLRKNNAFERVDLDSVDYLHSEGNYITLFVSSKQYVLKYSLSKLIESSAFKNFTRIHRSYAIHSDKMVSVNFAYKTLVIVGDKELPFGRTYVKDIRNLMNVSLK